MGLYLTNSFNRDQFRLQQDSTKQQQDLAIKGQRADRFVKAIDQLGQEGMDKLGNRLGGIYALETLMLDSPDDESTVIEVLCAFVRTHAARPKTDTTQIPASPVDVRAAMNVLGRRPKPRQYSHIDLSNTSLGLDHIVLSGAHLTGVHLFGADLRGADLSNADLSGADLREADLTSATLSGAGLRFAKLSGAGLRGANLYGANLYRAYLFGADLRESYLIGARLTTADLHDANLTGADLRNADLNLADLTGAALSGADLTGADLTGARGMD